MTRRARRRVDDRPRWRDLDPDAPPDKNAVTIMTALDGLQRPYRKLIYEFGFAIVRDVLSEGQIAPLDLFDMLAVWRERRQEQWLNTDYIEARQRDIIAAALERSEKCNAAGAPLRR